jgi:hypothetical protein
MYVTNTYSKSSWTVAWVFGSSKNLVVESLLERFANKAVEFSVWEVN